MAARKIGIIGDGNMGAGLKMGTDTGFRLMHR